jgi:diguanylate cyclase (GGDEF)-like protein/PAS domain S-box-containing protein
MRLSFRAQIALLVTLSVAGVSAGLLFLQERSIEEQLLDSHQRLVESSATNLEDELQEVRLEGGSIHAALVQGVVEQAEELRADEIVVTDRRGRILAEAGGALAGGVDPEWEEKRRALRARSSTVAPEDDGGKAGAVDVIVAMNVPGFGRTAFAVEDGLDDLRPALNRARSQGLIPSLLGLLVALPLAVYVTTRFAEQARRKERETERRAEEILYASEERTRLIVETASDAFISSDSDGVLTYWNRAAVEMFGWSSEEALGRRFTELTLPEGEREAYEAGRERFLATGDWPLLNRRVEVTGWHRDGHSFLMELTVWSLEENERHRFHAFIRDITERQRAEDVLRRSEERFRSLVQNAADAIVVMGADSTITYVSPAVERILGYSPEEEMGSNVFTHIHPEDVATAGEKLGEILVREGAVATAEVRARHKSGSWRWLEASGRNLLHDDSVAGIVLNYRDVTERRALEEQLTRQAFEDSLTGLANRALFLDRVSHALAHRQREDEPMAVLLMDLDDFKSVNDRLGHDAGDEVLVEVARRLRGCLRPADTAARLSGDEFALLLDSLGDGGDVIGVVERLMEVLRKPIDVREVQLTVSTSIGVVITSDGNEGQEQVLRNADVAMYKAKSGGRGRYEIYEPGMRAALLERLELRGDLERALDREEFLLEYQPIVSLEDGKSVGCEALVRWHHPVRGLISPATFIPLAEETGLILPLGRWVLQEACNRMRAWQLETGELLSLSINLSARQFEQSGLSEEVTWALRDSGLAPNDLVLEITESLSMENTEVTISKLAELKGLGVGLAIDDFGTGYSSLAYLKRFPIDSLKIDKAFVDGVAMGAEEAALANAVVRLSDSLGLRTVAEGIEHHDQVEALIRLGCVFGQGYYFARPLSAEDFRDFLLQGMQVAASGA